MLYQIHWQFKDGKTEMRSQKDIDASNLFAKAAALKRWIAEAKEDHPLPKGAQWLVCNKKSEHFLWAVAEEEAPKDSHGQGSKIHEKMGYFEDFKFGVPVEVFRDGKRRDKRDNRLIFEDDLAFTVITDDGPYPYTYYKDNHSYKLIPYSADRNQRLEQPRYPLVSSKQYVAYCNVGNNIDTILAEPNNNIAKVKK